MKKVFRELLAYIGFSMVGFGLYQIWPPASFIICGSFLFWISAKKRT